MNKTDTSTLLTVFKSILIGVIASEVWIFSYFCGQILQIQITSLNLEVSAIIMSFSLFTLCVAYLLANNIEDYLTRLILSLRFDLLLLFFLGIVFSIYSHDFTSYWSTLTKLGLNSGQVLLLILTPYIIVTSLLIRKKIFKIKKPSKIPSSFLVDVEGRAKKDDLLDFTSQATKFADRVFNGGSSDSLVFGIDAPWGIGKSTFINYCVESWETNEAYKNKLVVYKFNPLRYESHSSLFEKFIDGLIVTLQKASFIPEIKPIISKYSRLVKSKATFSFMGFEFTLLPRKQTVDDVFDDLYDVLKNFDKKIIIVIDDLDRLSFAEVKDVLFAIKKSFTLPNITYVLCYETENLLTLNGRANSDDSEKVREFLDKFINIKTTLFLSSDVLAKYVSTNFEEVLKNNPQLNDGLKSQISQAISALLDIYDSAHFHDYQPFVGDVRKLKKLINTMMLLEVESIDFGNSDFDKKDFLNLVLIYINYPHIFRKIYNEETGKRRGYFSVVLPYDKGYPKDLSGRHEPFGDGKYQNSEMYTKYLCNLSDPQKFLLNQIFDVSVKFPDGMKVSEVSEKMKGTSACFNGSWGLGKNLEEYLNLIVHLVRPKKDRQYTFYEVLKDKIKYGTPIEEIFEGEEFGFTKSEYSHQQLWDRLIKDSYQIKDKIGFSVIRYLINNIDNYSIFANEKIGLGLRDDLNFSLVRFLDVLGWYDSDGLHSKNSDEKDLTEITDWIFGEGAHAEEGVLNILSQESRGIRGIYDLMIFRLYCSADRGGNAFNLERALTTHSKPSVKSHGEYAHEMRKISQEVFSIFKKEYILKEKNIFTLIDNLSLEELSGKYHKYLLQQLSEGSVNQDEIDNQICVLKSKMKTFIIYQLGNKIINSGVGCGYYDESGDGDGCGISVEVNKYIFEQCFNPLKTANGYKYFVDYLLMNLSNNHGIEKEDLVANMDGFTKVLNRELLLEYWELNSVHIKALKLETVEKKFITVGYEADYSKDLKKVYEVLDKELGEYVKSKIKKTEEVGDKDTEIVKEG